MVTNPDGVTKYPDFTSTDAAAYPLVKIDYAMIPTVVKTAAQAASLKRFLAFESTTAQEHLPLGYTPLPPDLVAQVNAAAAAITVAGSKPAVVVTPTTTPPTTPVSDLGPIGDDSGFGSDTSGSASTTPVATTTPTTPKAKKPVASKKLARVIPVVNVAGAGERYGLPVIAALALIAALYPLGRRARPRVQKAAKFARSRVRGPKTPAPGTVS
jgi:hypothetical protein